MDNDCGPGDDSDEANCPSPSPTPKIPDTSFVSQEKLLLCLYILSNYN